MSSYWQPNDRVAAVGLPDDTYVTSVNDPATIHLNQAAKSTAMGTGVYDAPLAAIHLVPNSGIGANFYKTLDPPNQSYPAGTTVVATYAPATGYRNIVAAYTILPGGLGSTPLFAGIRLTYSNGTTKSREYNGNPALTTTRASSTWSSYFANDGLGINKVEFYVRNASASAYPFNVGQFTFDGEQS